MPKITVDLSVGPRELYLDMTTNMGALYRFKLFSKGPIESLNRDRLFDEMSGIGMKYCGIESIGPYFSEYGFDFEGGIDQKVWLALGTDEAILCLSPNLREKRNYLELSDIAFELIKKIIPYVENKDHYQPNPSVSET